MSGPTCQWIEGEVAEGGTGYGALPKCVAPAQPGSSYCPAHHARCHRPAPLSVRNTTFDKTAAPGFGGAARSLRGGMLEP